MSDLISKAEVLKHQRIRIGRDFDEAYRVACVDVETIKGLPTVDAEPIKHGHWEIHQDVVGNTYSECSCCHTTWWEVKSEDNYCSECGAKMDEEVNDDN